MFNFRGKITLEPSPKTRSWYLLGVAFKKSDEDPVTFMWEYPPSLFRDWVRVEQHALSYGAVYYAVQGVSNFLSLWMTKP